MRGTGLAIDRPVNRRRRLTLRKELKIYMTKIIKVSLGEFTRLGNAKLVISGRNKVTKLTGNASFTDLPKPLTEVTADIDDFDTKTAASLSGDRNMIAQRDLAREVVLTDLRDYAATVQTQSANNLATLTSSGFEATKTRTPVGVPTPPVDLRLSYTGNTGELYFRFKKGRGVVSYMIQSSTSADGARTTHPPSTSSRVTLTGFTPGTIYFVWVAAVGSAGMSSYSGPVMIMAV
jgi:hypothetical protein